MKKYVILGLCVCVLLPSLANAMVFTDYSRRGYTQNLPGLTEEQKEEIRQMQAKNNARPDCAKHNFNCDQFGHMSYAEYMAMVETNRQKFLQNALKTVEHKKVTLKKVYPPFPGLRMCIQ